MWRDSRSTDVSQYPTNEDCLQRLAPNMTYRRPMFKICRGLCASVMENRKSRSSGFFGLFKMEAPRSNGMFVMFQRKNKLSVDIDCSQSLHMERKMRGNELGKAITRQG